MSYIQNFYSLHTASKYVIDVELLTDLPPSSIYAIEGATLDLRCPDGGQTWRNWEK